MWHFLVLDMETYLLLLFSSRLMPLSTYVFHGIKLVLTTHPSLDIMLCTYCCNKLVLRFNYRSYALDILTLYFCHWTCWILYNEKKWISSYQCGWISCKGWVIKHGLWGAWMHVPVHAPTLIFLNKLGKLVDHS
jgi:hypothetical protein